MATITYDSGAVKTIGTTALTTASPGRAGGAPIFGGNGRTQKVVTGTIAFDASYPTGGEDISDLFALFRSTSGVKVFLDQPIAAGAQTGKFARVDKTNQKVQLFTNAAPFAEVANTSDQSATSIDFLAIGPA